MGAPMRLLALLALIALLAPVHAAVSVRKLKKQAGHDELLAGKHMTPALQVQAALEARFKETTAALEHSSSGLKAVLGDGGMSEDEARCFLFLMTNMPQRDLEDQKHVDLPFLFEHIRLALRARSTYPWASSVDFDVFMNDVLPFAVFDENREAWRPMMLEKTHAIVQPLMADYTHTPQQFTRLINAINTQLWSSFGEPPIVFVPNRTPDVMSPAQVLAARNASCTGLSLFLTFALRSVGIPARVAGVPLWNTETGGNHNWVEALGPDGWHFTGAHEPVDAGLDRGWFSPEPVNRALPATPADRMHAVYASAYSKEAGSTADPAFTLYFPLGWNTDITYVPGVDVTSRYVQHPPSSLAEELPQ